MLCRKEESVREERDGKKSTHPRPPDGLSNLPLTLPLQSSLSPRLNLAHARNELARNPRVHRAVCRVEGVNAVPHEGVVCRTVRGGRAEGEGAGEVGLGRVRDEEGARGEVLRGDDLVAGEVAEDGRGVCRVGQKQQERN